MDLSQTLAGYDLSNLTVGSLGGHSALDTAHGARRAGLKSLVVAQKGRDRTYAHYARRDVGTPHERGCVDEMIVVEKFQHVLRPEVKKQLQELNTVFVMSRYFWVYFDDYALVETKFDVPIFGARHMLKLEERDQPYTQYDLLHDAKIRTPKIFKKPADIDRLCIVKAAEATRSYERGFFLVKNASEWEKRGDELCAENKIGCNWRNATIEEFVVGAPVNFNFFYSPLTGELELLGTDTRRQTNLDGFLRMTAGDQAKALDSVPLKMVETGHIACTVKESLLEKAFAYGEQFVKATQNLPKELDPSGKGIIGPFALQGAVVAEEGKEDIVIFDVSLRIPGSPGTRSTPYSGYFYGEQMSVGERIGREIKRAAEEKRLEEVVT